MENEKETEEFSKQEEIKWEVIISAAVFVEFRVLVA